MNRNDIIYELKNRGYHAEPQEVVKNGVLKEGIILRTSSNIAPTVYVDDFIKRGLTASEAAEACIRIFESNNSISFDVNQLLSRSFLWKNCYLGLQKTSDENITKEATEYEGIEAYVYVRIDIGDGKGSIKITPDILKRANVSGSSILRHAKENTFKETKFVNLADMLGIPEEVTGFTCITNECQTKGASAILNKDALKSYGEKYGTHRIIAIPSSVHEWILIPYSEEMDIDMFTAMVREVNDAQVAPEEQLANRAYIIEV